MTKFLSDTLDWDKMQGLIPAIIQNAKTGQILMLGYMNQEALAITLETGDVTFYSRSQNKLWRKGETSGDTLELVELTTDCDGDSLLVLVNPKGSTCHLGFTSCFRTSSEFTLVFLERLVRLIKERQTHFTESSYTRELLSSGLRRCAQKVGEEAVEVVIASLCEDREEFIEESCDLIYHWLVLLACLDVDFYEILERLEGRRKTYAA